MRFISTSVIESYVVQPLTICRLQLRLRSDMGEKLLLLEQVVEEGLEQVETEMSIISFTHCRIFIVR